jgi:hypothetical protein
VVPDRRDVALGERILSRIVRAVSHSPRLRAGSDGKMYSHDEIACAPGSPPIASTVVPASLATARRRCFGSSRKTIVPHGASISSPSTVKVAWPRITTYASSWVCSV